MAEPEPFLVRWSRLKRRTREGAHESSPAAAPEAAPAAAVPAAPTGDAADSALPSIDSLTKDSDYTGFLRPGVPDALRNQALRKLYESDPVFANLDGLLEYGEDFGEPFRNAGVIATAYRVLQGMPAGEKEAQEPAETTAPEAAATPENALPKPEPGTDQSGPAESDLSASAADRKAAPA